MDTIIACEQCGTAFSFDKVPATNPKTGRPGKQCPGCFAPLDAVAVDHMHFPATNPADPKDELRTVARKQALADAALHADKHVAAVSMLNGGRVTVPLAARPAPPAGAVKLA